MSYLALVRHGESRWNLANRFTGWVDVPLTAAGVREAEHCARQLKGIDFDLAFTSNLERAQATLLIILSRQNRTGIFQHNGESKLYRWAYRSNVLAKDDIPIYRREALNERYYGDLQGLRKTDAEKRYGRERVLKWRRGFTAKPPKGESLKQAFARVLPAYRDEIERALRRGKNVIVAAHGNVLRAIIKYIEDIPDQEIPFLELPQGRHILYHYGKRGYRHIDGDGYHFDRPLR